MPCCARKCHDGVATGGGRRRTARISLCAHGQEQRARHRVARVLVDEPDHLGERQRFVRVEQLRVRRQRAEAHAAADRPTRLLPERAEQAVREVGRLHDGTRHRELTAPRRVPAREFDAVAGRAFGHRDHDAAGATLARARIEADVVVDREVRGPGVRADSHGTGGCVRYRVDGDRLEIHQQCVGKHVVRAVRQVVESAAIVAHGARSRCCR